MPSPLLYDFRRTLTSKSVLIIMALLILVSFGILVSLSQVTTSGQQSGPIVSALTYRDSNGYHFLVYSTNQFGQPVSGARANFNLTDSSNKTYQGSGITNSSGFVLITINAPASLYTIGGSVTAPGFPTALPIPTESSMGSNGSKATPEGIVTPVYMPLSGSFAYPVTLVVDSNNASQRAFQVFVAAPFGAPPANYAVYYKFLNVSQLNGPPPVPQESQMQFLGNLTSYATVFQAPTPPGNVQQNDFLEIQVFYPNGTAIAAAGLPLFSVNQIYIPRSTIQTSQFSSLLTSFFAGIFGIFVPFMAVLGSYNSYGKDRVSGVLESVLSKPVTRRGLAISRFLSTFLAMAVAIFVSIGVIDLLFYYYAGALVDSTFLVASAGAFLVDLAAFMGIMFILSHLVKSTGALIGLGVVLVLVFDVFWGLIEIVIAEVLHISLFSVAFYQLQFAAQFANPANFVSLVDTYLTKSSGIGTINPADYGITIPSLVAAGALWVAAPLAIYLYLATKRD